MDLQKQVEIKEEELNMNKNKLNDSKMNAAKNSKNLKAMIQQSKEELAKIEEEIVKVRKISESQEVKELKKELANKQIQNIEISKQYEQIKAVKENFENQLNKLKSDYSKSLRMMDYERKLKEDQEREVLTRRRLELENNRFQYEEALQIKDAREKMLILRTKIK